MKQSVTLRAGLTTVSWERRVRLKSENKHYNVVLVTNMQNVTRAYGIEAENYSFSRN